MDLKRTQSQKKAQDKYVKVSTRSYAVRYNRINDADVIEMLDRVDNKQEYIRTLIRKDIEEHGGSPKSAAKAVKDTRTVTVSYNKKTMKWHASCPQEGLNLKSDSYDILLNKVKDSLKENYIVKTEEQIL